MSTKKKTIPKVVKTLAWEKWVGEDVAKTKCLCCGVTEIKLSSFHCGHVISEANGCSTTVDNLRPICSACNLSMGKENFAEFKKRCGFDVPKDKSVTPPPKKVVEKKEIPSVVMTTAESDHIKKRSLLIRRKLLVLRPPPGQDIYYDECTRCKAYYHNAFDDKGCPGCK